MLHFQRWKLILVFGIVVAGILFALPNMFPAATMARMPAWLPHKQVNLGLDLQGGAHLLYQLDEKEMVDDWLNTVRGDVRETLRRTHIGYTDLSQDVATRSVSVKIRDAAEMDKADTELKKLAQPVGGSVFAGFSGYDIDVARQGDRVDFTRTSVGKHLLLGGDNLDLTLTWLVEAKLGKTLSIRQRSGLRRQCASAKACASGVAPISW